MKALLLLLASCGAPARGVLVYGVATAPGVVATVELDTEFSLVVRRGAATAKIALGPPDYDVVGLALSGDGKLAATAGLDGYVRLFDLEPPRARAAWRLDAAATAVALSPDGVYLLHGSGTGVVCLRRTEDGALLQCVAAHDARVTTLVFSGGATVVSTARDGRSIVWDVPSLRVRALP